MIDTNKAVREILKADAAVIALVPEERIFAVQMEDGAAFPNIVFQTVGGETEVYVPHIQPRVQFRCWHDNPREPEKAREVYRALHDALYDLSNVNVPNNGGFLLRVFEEGHGQDLTDPEKGWPHVLSFWRFIFRKD